MPAGDVNSLDEIPTSSWYAARAVDMGTMARGPDGPGPPRPPFAVLSEDARAVARSGFSISDGRGQRYEIVIDPADRPEMRTGAAAIAARLVWACGLHTPPVYVVQAQPEQFWRSEAGAPDVPALLGAGPPAALGSYRVAALAMPPSVWLGYASESGTRGDDPNDVVPHEDRRVLRSLNVFASWMALSGLGPEKTMDRYVGIPGQGHVVHFSSGSTMPSVPTRSCASPICLPARGAGHRFFGFSRWASRPIRRRVRPRSKSRLSVSSIPTSTRAASSPRSPMRRPSA